MKHSIQLTNASAVLLNSILTFPEQFKDTGETLRASYLLNELDFEMPKFSKEDTKQLDLWAKENFKLLEITEPQRDLIKKSISFVSSKGAIPPSKVAIELLEAFGFAV